MPLLRRAAATTRLPCLDYIESALFICDTQHSSGEDENDGNIDAIFLGGNHIGDRGVARIVYGLEDYIQYRKLYLCDNRISQDGALLISKSLRHNKTLIELSLGNNLIGDEGACLLASSLSQNDTLEILNLENNGIGCRGTKAIVELGLMHNSVIQYLVLSENPIEDDGAKALLRCIRDTSSLANLYLCNHTLLSIILKKVTLDGRILRDIKSYLKVNRMSNNSPVSAATRKILLYIKENPEIFIEYMVRIREVNPDLELCIMPRVLSLLGNQQDLATMNIILQNSPGLFWRANGKEAEFNKAIESRSCTEILSNRSQVSKPGAKQRVG